MISGGYLVESGNTLDTSLTVLTSAEAFEETLFFFIQKNAEIHLAALNNDMTMRFVKKFGLDSPVGALSSTSLGIYTITLY